MPSTAWDNVPDEIKTLFQVSEHTAGGDALLSFASDVWFAGYDLGNEDGVEDTSEGRVTNPYFVKQCEAQPAGHCPRQIMPGHRLCPIHLGEYRHLITKL